MKAPLLLLIAYVAALLTGCGTVAAIRQPFIRSTNAVPVVVTTPGATNLVERIVPAATNIIAQPDGTLAVNIRPAYVTNLVTIEAPRSITNYVTNVTVAVNPALESALSTVSTVNQFNPTPSAPIVQVALSLALGGLGFFARLKTRAANENASIARTAILAIEEAKSAETKAAAARLSQAVGNAPQLNAMVQKLTRAVG
jgi:hypothetical protein